MTDHPGNVSARRVAAIDIGTNTVLMTIVEAHGSEQRVLADEARITRLGEGVGESSRLRPEAIARTLAALQEFAAQIERTSGLQQVAAVGTSALRDAKNADALLGPTRALLGVDVQIIDGQEEAELTFAGAMLALGALSGSPARPADVPATVIDLGGGSTELIRGTCEPMRIEASLSLQLGSVRLFEQHLHHDPPTPEEVASLQRHVAEVWQRHALPLPPSCIGVAGTITSLAHLDQCLAMQQQLPFDAASINGHRLTHQRLGDLSQRLLALPAAQRHTQLGVQKGREDVLLAGALLLQALMSHAQLQWLTVSTGGVRIGLIHRLLDALSSGDH